MYEFKKKILITGGAGFIGSHLTNFFVRTYPQYLIINIDKLTYAGNVSYLKDVEKKKNYLFQKGDITNKKTILHLFKKYNFDYILHLAAESHVDRSIKNAYPFVKTNVLGTIVLLETARKFWENKEDKLFFHVSTDEVYGSCLNGNFSENTCYNPSSAYAASKAASDHFVRAFHKTYNLPYLISNCTNNYGPRQHMEKLIPLAIKNMLKKKSIPIYKDGQQIRNWLFVVDHIEAIDFLLHHPIRNTTFNIGTKTEQKNIDILSMIADIVDTLMNRQKGTSQKLFKFVTDRPGHDFRYALNTEKINKLGWEAKTSFQLGIKKTIQWYLSEFLK